MKKTLINIIQIWMTELKEIMRDKGILIFIIFVPLCYPLLYSYVYTNEVVRDVPFAVIDDCNSTTSREFIRKMDATPDARFVARCNDVAEAQELLKESKIYGVLRIPKTFNHDIWRGEQTTVGLYCNMSSLLYYKALLLAANNVSLDMNRDIKVENTCILHPAKTKRYRECLSSMTMSACTTHKAALRHSSFRRCLCSSYSRRCSSA